MKKNQRNILNKLANMVRDQIAAGDPIFVRNKYDELVSMDGNDDMAIAALVKAMMRDIIDDTRTKEYDVERYEFYVSQLPLVDDEEFESYDTDAAN